MTFQSGISRSFSSASLYFGVSKPPSKSKKDKVEITLPKQPKRATRKPANDKIEITDRAKRNVLTTLSHWASQTNPWEETSASWYQQGIKSIEERRKTLKETLKVHSALLSAAEYEKLISKKLRDSEKAVKDTRKKLQPYQEGLSFLNNTLNYLKNLLHPNLPKKEQQKIKDDLRNTQLSLKTLNNTKPEEEHHKALDQEEKIRTYVQQTRNGLPATPEGVTIPAISRQFFVQYAGKKKELWTSGLYETGADNLTAHLRKHWEEFKGQTILGDKIRNKQDYLQITRKFTDGPPPGTEMRIEPHGDIVYYYPEENLIAAIKYDGTPKTFFKPTGLNNQAKYNVFLGGNFDNLSKQD